MSELNYQQELVWNRLRLCLDGVNEANEFLEKRATKLVAISTAVVASVASANLFPKSVTGSGGWDAVALAVMCALNMRLIWVGLNVWGPSSKATPGSTNADQLIKNFIEVDKDVAYQHGVRDFTHSIGLAMKWNEVKGQHVTEMLWTVQWQIFVLVVSVVIRLIS